VAYEKIWFVTLRMKRVIAGLVIGVLFSALPAHALSGGATEADEKAGAILFRDKGCPQCHGVGGVGGVPGKNAPALVDIRSDKQWTPARITEQILNGGQKMPPFSESVTDAEAAQLVAYLRAKHRPVPPPAGPPDR
jgi:mono/diheme cytochrome c family protein